jgi:hypothetical protein
MDAPVMTPSQDPEAGTSMIELVVGMCLMTVFMTMFTSAIFVMYRSTAKADARFDSAAQLNVAFLRLDKEVRYASALSSPGRSAAGDWYAELKATNTGTTVCTQLRLKASVQQLQRRTWTVVSGAATNITSWIPLASRISNGTASPGAASQPFTLTAADSTVNFEKLKVYLVATSGPAASPTSAISSVNFAALNTSLTTPTTGVCAEVART